MKTSTFILHCKAKDTCGIALVVTLLVIVILTVAVTAFMQSMSLERRTSQAYLSILKSEVAVNAGLERVKNILAANTKNDSFTIAKVEATASSGPYYFIGTGNDVAAGGGKTSAATTYTPLFSYLGSPSAIPTPVTPVAGDPHNKPNVPVIPAGIAANSKPVLPNGLTPVNTSWETVQTGDPQFPQIRYSFWVEDLAGYLDAGLVGNTDGTLSSHVRTNGTDPKEIALFTLFDSTVDIDPGTTAAKDLVTNRNLLLTSQTLQQGVATANPVPTATTITNNLAIGALYDKEQEVIPAGFGYKDAGLPKYNLNTLVTGGGATAVTAIAKLINDNLPLFNTAARKGSFPSNQDYVKNLAANIIDYVDADNNATVGTDYRGIDSYPFLVEHYLRFRWRGPNPNEYFASGGTWKTKVDVDLWIELWNPSDKDITSGTFKWDDSGNEYSIYVAGNAETPLFPEPGGAVTRTVTFTAGSPLRKNEYKVINFPVVSYTCDSGTSSAQPKPSGTSSKPKISKKNAAPAIDHYSSNYSILWNNIAVDRPSADTSPASSGNRIERKSGTLDNENGAALGTNNGGGADWRGSYPGLRYNVSSESTFNLGDPRSSYNVTAYQGASDYDSNSSWYGRAYQYSLIKVSNPAWLSAETTPSLWPDGGHDSTRGYNIYEIEPGPTSAQQRNRNNKTPADIAPADRPAYDDKAPAHISNSGTYTSVLELGSIYDPAQWRPDWAPTGASPLTPKPADAAAMKNAWSSLDTQPMINDVKSPFYGLCSTLRIGQGEFLTLDNAGTRAAQLLDLMTANTNSQQSLKGRININTASRDVLRALYAGIKLTKDAGLEPASLVGTLYEPNTGASPIVAADVFADTIIANRPYLSLAKLSTIRTSIDDPTSTASPKVKLPLFGNAKLWPAAKRPSAWNDLAREEIFSKTFELATVRSRNFRVYVTGQVLNSRGRVASQNTKSFIINVSAPRTSTGAVDTTKQVSIKNVYEINK